MNFHQLLHQRHALQRQARLAGVAYAYQRLGDFAARIAQARLHGLVALRPADPAGEPAWPTLTALEGSQAVLDEHFLDEEVVELADILEFLGEEVPSDGLAFRLEELESRFRSALRRELESSGVSGLQTGTPAA